MRQNWSQVSEVEPVEPHFYTWDHFILFWWQFTNMQKPRARRPQPARQMQQFTCLLTSLGVWWGRAGFSCLQRGKNCSCDNVIQCVLTIELPTLGMSSRKSSHLEDLLMYCDSGCQQFSSTLSSCNFQPSPLHWYHFKSPLTISHTRAAGSIDGSLRFWCFTLCQSKGRCFQNRCAAQLT